MELLENSIYPFLLVNIGSGVSIVKFDENNKYERIGGTSLGGGLFLGLCNALTGVKDYDQLLLMSQKGSYTQDVLVAESCIGSDTPPR